MALRKVLRHKHPYFPNQFSRLITSQASNSIGEEVKYPPIKPKYPPGRWTGFSPSEAWKWYEDQLAIESLPTIQERLYENIGSKNQLYYFNCFPFSRSPNQSDFYEEITKSRKIDDVHSNLKYISVSEDRMKDICSQVEAITEEEHHNCVRDKLNDMPPQKAELKRRKLFLESILAHLLTYLAPECPSLLDSQLDKDVNLQTHWVRGGGNVPKEPTFCQVRPGAIRYGFKQNVAFQLRNCLPLALNNSSVEDIVYSQTDNDIESEETDVNNPNLGHFNPHHRGLIKKCYSLPHQPGFIYGAPNEFTCLSVVSPDICLKSVRQSLGDSAYNDAVQVAGMLHSFASCHAMAHYQGYDMHHDLQSPLMTQCLVTDGREFTKISYQLNTLCLFKGDVDNSRYNKYSSTDTYRLYEHVSDTGKVIGFNPDTVQLIVRSLLAETSTEVETNPYIQSERKTPKNGDLLPYLPTYEQFSDLPTLEEGSVDIPTFTRYTHGNEPESEWDLSRTARMRRIKEKEYTAFVTRGPLYGSYDPPSRGRTRLDNHFTKVRKQEREKRIKLRDQVLDYLSKQKSNKDTV